MGIWILLFLCNVLIPLMMIVIGKLFIKYPPKKINNFYGYRTSMSSKNQETWDFAHAYCGKLWWKIGWMMLLAIVIVMFGVLWSGQINENETLISYASLIIMMIETAVLVGSIIPVERALKKTFDKNGKRK